MSHTAHVREEALHLENVRQIFQVLRVIQYQEFIVIYLSHPLTVRIVIRSLLLYSPFRRFLCVFVSITLINGLFEVNCLEVTNVLSWRPPIRKRPQENRRQPDSEASVLAEDSKKDFVGWNNFLILGFCEDQVRI